MKGEPRHSLNEPCQWPRLAPVQLLITSIPANVQPQQILTDTCSGNTGEAWTTPARVFFFSGAISQARLQVWRRREQQGRAQDSRPIMSGARPVGVQREGPFVPGLHL